MYNKKSALVFKGIASLVVSGIILIAFLSAGKSYGKGDLFVKEALARDIAILIDEMYSVPGVVEYVYPLDLSGFGVVVIENKVKVHEAGKKDIDLTAGEYSYAGIKGLELNVELDGLYKIKLMKSGGGTISIEKVR